ncbi:hypothetical protein HanOQP8_Chr11g0405191 [Helianthus annuus]|nr:hypothetical protein HanOQP8_Chr11g0405191 [Helianthus annuus]
MAALQRNRRTRGREREIGERERSTASSVGFRRRPARITAAAVRVVFSGKPSILFFLFRFFFHVSFLPSSADTCFRQGC